MTLADFMAARLAEDEAAATPGRRDLDDLRFDLKRGDAYEQHLSSRIEDGLDAQTMAWQARARREVAAKRELVRLHGPMSIQPGHPMFNDAHLTREPMRLCRSCEPETMFRRAKSYPCRTILQLAAIWNDHPDYDPAWRPE